jgi:hypothetical protein
LARVRGLAPAFDDGTAPFGAGGLFPSAATLTSEPERTPGTLGSTVITASWRAACRAADVSGVVARTTVAPSSVVAAAALASWAVAAAPPGLSPPLSADSTRSGMSVAPFHSVSARRPE